MRPPPRPRISTHASCTPLAGLADALNSVVLPELPAGTEFAEAAHPNLVPAWQPGRVILRREKAHRGGKTVTIVDDFATHLPLAFIERLAVELRTACGSGGTVRERRVEIQGDQAGKIRMLLVNRGFTVAGVK